MNTVGCKRWAIAEGYIPGQSHGPEPELESHETCCILNAGDSQARIAITIYFRGSRTGRALHDGGGRPTDPAPAVQFACE